MPPISNLMIGMLKMRSPFFDSNETISNELHFDNKMKIYIVKQYSDLLVGGSCSARAHVELSARES